MAYTILCLTAIFATFAVATAATHVIAEHYNWQSKCGFYLALENTANDGRACVLQNAKLVLGVGDGQQWKFLVATPSWEYNRTYTVRAVLANQVAKLEVDGNPLETQAVLKPSKGYLYLNRIQPWTIGQADYIMTVESVTISGGKPTIYENFRMTTRPIAVLAMEPQEPRRLKWAPSASGPIVIQAKFRFARYPDLHSIAPIIDRYGQLRYAEWPGKVRNDQDIVAEGLREDKQLRSWGSPGNFDRFGGWKLAGSKEKPTGFYRLTKRDGFWWLVTPEGNPCFYLGMCTVPAINWPVTPVSGREYIFEWLPPKEGVYKSAWRRGAWGNDSEIDYLALHTVNLIRKYGDAWINKAIDNTRRRLRAWGFSGAGKWSEIGGLPVVPVLNRRGVPNLVRHPDIFDSNIRAKFAGVIKQQVEPRRNDPMILGWSLGNEFDEIITAEEIREILKKPKTTPAVKELSRRVPDGDIEAMRRCYARAYYEFIYRTVKSIDRNHLYFGFWIVPGWWENEEDWRLIAPYCDAIGYDLYSYECMDSQLVRLSKESGKPIICGEFSFPPFYGGTRGFGCYQVWAEDDDDAGRLYVECVKAAAQNPYCVGLMWFEYRDQPLTGRGAGKEIGPVIGEHYAFGFVDVADRPKWGLISKAREANLSGARWRLEAAKKNTTP
jgi:hypothetical protein